MRIADFKELERLVSDLYDEGLSPSEMARLEALLINNPSARTQYRSLVDTHLALSVASSSLEAEPQKKQANDAIATPMARAVAPSTSPPRAPSAWGWPLATAAALLLASSLVLIQSLGQISGDALSVHSQSRFADLATLPTVTHVSWEGPAFQSLADQSLPPMTVSPGAIRLRLKEGKTADGYVFCLRPGMSVDLVASFDATGENSLSIVELTGGQQSVTKKLTFHNAGEGPRPLHANPSAKNRRYGVLGHWTEINSGALPRFFLLTGVHKLAQPTPGEEWRLSELEVLLENDDAAHIGWDDSGPVPHAGESYQQDGDYDDLAASLFFSPLEGNRWTDASGLRVVSGDEDSRLEVPANLDEGFAFDLPPGAMAMVKGVSEARYPSGMVIVDADTNEVLWSRSKSRESNACLGAACISNHSLTSRALRVVGVHKPLASDASWRQSAMKTLYEQPRFTILGFDDSLGDEDYNDVRINLLMEGGQTSD
ncbi:hypothetical protein Pla108_04210 [Botrimarina colliarenosi]|uniref:Uncharacterized protein n=1 Tax=Botrimarina colliarenosi TaxID=2528001 RepID=A0A5C6AHG3_9BACT|nr:hypothetical protein [Botrimarina colliarenosi]TWT99482.1 hypothetical protein Pla108_04210 [Botrimarina colliarenosi]